MAKYDQIIAFIAEKHKGQVDKSGKPYIVHPVTVALNCKSESGKRVALLHDVLEDTDATIEELIQLGLSDEEIEAVVLLTKPKKEDYMDYVKRVAKNPIAREVKLQDLTHNMDLTRLKEITEKDLKRKEKYEKAYQYLIDCEKNLEE